MSVENLMSASPVPPPRPTRWLTWYLPALAVLLAAAASAQVAWTVPRFVASAAEFGLRVPTPLETAAIVPAWAAVAAGLAAAGLAVWRRGSPRVPAAVAAASLALGGLLAAGTLSCQNTLLQALAQ